jgi:hypothetical protein
MRVRILKNFTALARKYIAGEVVEVEFPMAHSWIKLGLAMQDKSEDGPTTTK